MKQRSVPENATIRISISLLFLFLLIAPSAATQVEIQYFHEDGCSKCAQASRVLDRVMDQYPNLTLAKFEINTPYNGTPGYERMVVHKVYSVPAIVVHNQTVIQYSDYNGEAELLEDLLIRAIADPPRAINTTNQSLSNVPELPELSLPVVFIAGLLAGFNPCLLAVLAFLASITLSSNRGRRELLIIVGGFSTGIFVVYMLVGLGLLGIIKQMPGISDVITMVLVALIGILGLWHFYDAYHLKLHHRSSIKTPGSLIRFIRSMEEGKNVLLISLLAGGIFSLVKAPCVGAVYFAILDLLITQGKMTEGSLYLGFYNLGVILPVLVLGGLMAFGLSPEKVTDFKEKWRIEIRLVTGAVLILLALLIYFKVI